MDNEEVWILGLIKWAARIIRELLVKMKVYVNRTAGYLSIINSGMILFLMLSKLKELGIANLDLSKYYIPIFL